MDGVVIVQKGEECNNVLVLRELSNLISLTDYFEPLIDDSDKFKKFFWDGRTVANKSFKVTISIQEI